MCEQCSQWVLKEIWGGVIEHFAVVAWHSQLFNYSIGSNEGGGKHSGPFDLLFVFTQGEWRLSSSEKWW